jgi:PKD repeat protein
MMRIIAVLALIVLVLSTLVGCETAVPKAKLSAIPLNGHPPLDVQFTDKSTGNISAWEWDFNDDGVVDSALQNATYTYKIPGNYTVSLTVRGPEGNDTEVKKDYIKVTHCPYFADFYVSSPSGNGSIPGNESIPVNCRFQGNGISCEKTTTVQFIDKSTGNVTAWDWDFNNDGTIDSTQQNPTHTYGTNGNYTVTLTITTSECKDTLTKWDYINITGCHT